MHNGRAVLEKLMLLTELLVLGMEQTERAGETILVGSKD